MLQSLKLGKVFGIELYVHGTFWLLPLFVLMSGLLAGGSIAGIGGDLALIFAVFGCIALHELGHALAARGYGIGTRDITLYPVGGVASLERMPEKPGREIAIALAGPAVNVVIALALFFGLMGESLLAPLTLSAGMPGALEAFLTNLMLANAVLAAFNLLPAFPMDGGRVLRALLAIRMPRVKATATAVGVGSFVAAGLFILGLTMPHFGLVAIGVVVFLLGQAELAVVRAQAAAREWNERVGEWLGPQTEATAASTPSSGLVWDEARGVWVQYDRGKVVRVIEPTD